MSRTDRWILVFLTTLALAVGACAQSSEPETTSDEGPAHIEDIAGSEVKRVTLTDEAAATGTVWTPIRSAASSVSVTRFTSEPAMSSM